MQSWWPEGGLGPWKLFNRSAPRASGLCVTGRGDEAVPVMETAIRAATAKLRAYIQEKIPSDDTHAAIIRDDDDIRLIILNEIWDALAVAVDQHA